MSQTRGVNIGQKFAAVLMLLNAGVDSRGAARSWGVSISRCFIRVAKPR